MDGLISLLNSVIDWTIRVTSKIIFLYYFPYMVTLTLSLFYPILAYFLKKQQALLRGKKFDIFKLQEILLGQY